MLRSRRPNCLWTVGDSGAKLPGMVGTQLLWCTLPGALLALATTPALTPRPLPPSDDLNVRIEIEATVWSSWWSPSDNRTDTLIVEASRGEDLDGQKQYVGWQDFGEGAPFWRGGREGPDQVWVRCSRDVEPDFRWYLPPGSASADSILVSTSWRSFHTLSFDAGMRFRLRVVPTGPPQPEAGDAPLAVAGRTRVSTGGSEFDAAVLGADVVGVFRLRRVASDDKRLLPARRSMAATELVFDSEQIWSGDEYPRGEPIRVLVPGGNRDDTSWSQGPGSTPMRVGDSVVLFLKRRRGSLEEATWEFSTYAGYGLFDYSGTLVFSRFGRGIPIAQFHRDVDRAAWTRRHPFRGRVRGRVTHSDTGWPASGLCVTASTKDEPSITDSRGLFEILGVPIGLTVLRVTGSSGRAAAVIEISDEFTDSLDVRVPF